VRLNEPEAKIEVYIAWRKSEESSAILDFLESARRVFHLNSHKEIA
jgi:hypothetical protein